jgi:hypothetical protein
LNRLLQRLNELLTIEQNIIEQRLPLKIEYEELRMVLHLEKLVLGLIVKEGSRVLSGMFRNNEVAGTNKEDIAINVSKILEIVELMLPLVDDIAFMSLPDFEVYLSKLLSNGVKFDRYIEILLLAGWSAAYNELLDIALGWSISK